MWVLVKTYAQGAEPAHESDCHSLQSRGYELAITSGTLRIVRFPPGTDGAFSCAIHHYRGKTNTLNGYSTTARLEGKRLIDLGFRPEWEEPTTDTKR